jgi:hypothetical protein
MARISVAVLLILISASACTGNDQEGSLGERMKEMTQKMVMDAHVQRAFLKGREKTVATDGTVRKEIFQQNLREQRAMLREPEIAPQLVRFNMDVTEQALRSGERDRFLNVNLEAMDRIAADPAKRNRLIRTLQKSREQAMKEDRRMRHDLLKEGMDEHYAALDTVTPMVLDYYMDVLERTLTDPTQKKRLMSNQFRVMQAIARDPQLRPRMIDLFIELMKDPKMKKEMMNLFMPMMEKMMKQMEQQMKQKMMHQMKQMQKNQQSKEQQMKQPTEPPAGGAPEEKTQRTG